MVDQADRGWSGVAGAVIAGPFHPVGVVAGPLDNTGVGPVPALRVEVLFPGDAGHDRGEDAFLLLRGGKAAGSAARRRTILTVRLNLTRSGSTAASVAALQIRALIA